MSSAADCEGFLWKEGKIIHNWKRRLFSLKGTKLLYFTDASKSVLCGSPTVVGVAEWSGKPNGLQIKSDTGRVFNVQAENANDRRKWLGAIDAAVRSRQEYGGMDAPSSGGSGGMINEFELLKGIGKGGFGRVILVKRKGGPDKGILMAMKILSKDLVKKTKQVESTIAERKILLDIEHPFVVNLRYSFQNAEKLYMVMDYFPGGSMYFHLCNERFFPPHVVKFFAQELVLALGHLHKNKIVYRDLKLENILMDAFGHIAVTDFGLAKLGISGDDFTNTFCGTPVYIAPEILLKKKYGHAVDWWACGTVLYEISVGRTPFQDRVRDKMFRNIVYGKVKFPSKLEGEPDFCDLVEGLMVKDPIRRLGSGPNGEDDVRNSEYFKGVTWADVYNKRITPPFKPKSAKAGENIEKNAIGMVARDTTVLDYSDAEFKGFTFAGEPGN